jgi:hypothetical protein
VDFPTPAEIKMRRRASLAPTRRAA